MPMIDTAQLKPASDATQKAHKEWLDAGQHEARVRERSSPRDPGGLERAIKIKLRAEWTYDQANRHLSQLVAKLIAQAEREAAAEG